MYLETIISEKQIDQETSLFFISQPVSHVYLLPVRLFRMKMLRTSLYFKKERAVFAFGETFQYKPESNSSKY